MAQVDAQSGLGELVGRLRGDGGVRDDEVDAGAIAELRALGYGIAHDGPSWRMTHNTERILPWELARGLQTSVLGRRAEYHDEIGSTQDRAIEVARSGGARGTVVVARTQQSGRGRRGRRWESPAGGLWMSVVIGECAGDASILPLAASLSLRDAILGTLGEKTGLVWPNDIVVLRDGVAHKVAGIVVDADARGESIEHAVIGVGINIGVDEDALNASIHGAARRAASLRGDAHAPRRLAQSFLLNLESVCARLGHDAAGIAAEWSRESGMMGRAATVRTESCAVSGTVVRIEPDGALVLRCGGREERFVAGEVVCVR